MSNPAANDEQVAPAATVEGLERPRLAPGVEIHGEMQGTGFVDRQWLIQRDGTFLQVTELLHRVAQQIDGERTLEEIAAEVTASTEWAVTAENVRQIIRAKLIPLGLVLPAGDAVAPPRKDRERSPLQINLRRVMLGPRVIDPVTKVLQHLYAPAAVVPLLLIVGVAYGWLYLGRGVSDAFRAALYTPGGLLVVLGIAIASGIFHEFGHAAALRYGGGQVRGMGVGLYVIYPTFYTDTTDAYRLGRWARLRTDLGGIYFHLLFGLALIGLYFVTGQELLLAVVLVISGDILYQLIPYLRLDGYWALTDLAGIPDFFSQTGPFLRSVLPLPGSSGGKLPTLKRSAKIAFAAYIALTIPVLAVLTAFMLWGFPRFMTTAWGAVRHQGSVFTQAWSAGDAFLVAAVTAQMVVLALSMLAAVYFVYSLARRAVVALWAWSRPTLVRRTAGTLAATAATLVLIVMWAPEFLIRVRMPAGVQRFPIESRLHVMTPVAYPQDPPVGGNHYPIWQNCGFYDAPIGREKGVHSLEHGAVWITYRPDLPREQVQVLRRLAHHESHILVSPYPDLSAPVVASAWGYQARLRSASDPLLGEFVHTFRVGPQAPERGGPCTLGIGQPE